MTGKITGPLREQSDWAQNDENRLGFIKNKPFSKRIERKIILPETILNNNAGSHEVIIDGETIQCSNHTIELNENIKANATYIVTYDGIDYILSSYEMYFIWGKVIGIGNGALSGCEVDVQNREFPFFIENNYENEEFLNSRCTYIGNDEHVLKIEQDEIIYDKLDTGYFPDEMRSDWNQNDPSAMNYIKNRPFYETDKIYGKVEIKETTIDAVRDEENNQWGAIVPYKGYFSSSELVASMYEVIVDGIEYVLPYTQVYSSAGYIGVEDINTSQKYPFSFWTVNGYGGTIDWRLVFATGGQHTVKITQIVKNGEVKTLDPKYLPTPLDLYWNAVGEITWLYANAECTEKAKVTDYQSAVASGRQIRVLQKYDGGEFLHITPIYHMVQDGQGVFILPQMGEGDDGNGGVEMRFVFALIDG